MPKFADLPSPPPAVIVGFELNGLGVSRALFREGVSCVAVTGPKRTAPLCTRAVKAAVHCRSWTEEAVMEALAGLGRTLEQPGVLIFTKDESVWWASRNRDELARYYKFTLPPDDVVRLLMNKALFYARAREAGWPVPFSVMVHSEEELRARVHDIPFPCILKPQLRNEQFRKQDVRKAFKLFDTEALFDAYRLVARWEPEVVVSEWVEGADSALISCRGYWGRDSRPLAHFMVRKLLQWPVETGIASIVEPAPAEWCADAIEVADRIFAETGMVGLGAVEFKRRPNGGLAITEPAVGRTVYSHEVATLNGINLVGICYADLAFGKNAAPAGALEGRPLGRAVKLLDWPNERKSALTYIRRGDLSYREWLRLRGGVRKDMTWRWSDPMPYLAKQAATLRSETGNLLNRLAPSLKAALQRKVAPPSGADTSGTL